MNEIRKYKVIERYLVNNKRQVRTIEYHMGFTAAIEACAQYNVGFNAVFRGSKFEVRSA